ncbi:ankyrin repeat domain-containing protein [Thermoproteota archaeon]
MVTKKYISFDSIDKQPFTDVLPVDKILCQRRATFGRTILLYVSSEYFLRGIIRNGNSFKKALSVKGYKEKIQPEEMESSRKELKNNAFFLIEGGTISILWRQNGGGKQHIMTANPHQPNFHNLTCDEASYFSLASRSLTKNIILGSVGIGAIIFSGGAATPAVLAGATISTTASTIVDVITGKKDSRKETEIAKILSSHEISIDLMWPQIYEVLDAKVDDLERDQNRIKKRLLDYIEHQDNHFKEQQQRQHYHDCQEAIQVWGQTFDILMEILPKNPAMNRVQTLGHAGIMTASAYNMYKHTALLSKMKVLTISGLAAGAGLMVLSLFLDHGEQEPLELQILKSLDSLRNEIEQQFTSVKYMLGDIYKSIFELKFEVAQLHALSRYEFERIHTALLTTQRLIETVARQQLEFTGFFQDKQLCYNYLDLQPSLITDDKLLEYCFKFSNWALTHSRLPILTGSDSLSYEPRDIVSTLQRTQPEVRISYLFRYLSSNGYLSADMQTHDLCNPIAWLQGADAVHVTLGRFHAACKDISTSDFAPALKTILINLVQAGRKFLFFISEINTNTRLFEALINRYKTAAESMKNRLDKTCYENIQSFQQQLKALLSDKTLQDLFIEMESSYLLLLHFTKLGFPYSFEFDPFLRMVFADHENNPYRLISGETLRQLLLDLSESSLTPLQIEFRYAMLWNKISDTILLLEQILRSKQQALTSAASSSETPAREPHFLAEDMLHLLNKFGLTIFHDDEQFKLSHEKRHVHITAYGELTQNMGIHHYFTAVRMGDLEKVQTLLTDPEINPLTQDKEKRTGLHHAIAMGHTNLTKFFLSQQGCLNSQDCYGNYPFHHAVIMQQFRQIDVIIQAGASQTAPNHFHKTPENFVLPDDQDAYQAALTRGTYKIPEHLDRAEVLAREGHLSEAITLYEEILILPETIFRANLNTQIENLQFSIQAQAKRLSAILRSGRSPYGDKLHRSSRENYRRTFGGDKERHSIALLQHQLNAPPHLDTETSCHIHTLLLDLYKQTNRTKDYNRSAHILGMPTIEENET